MITSPNADNSIGASVGSNNTWTQNIKVGDYVGNTLIDFRVENKTSDGISVVDGNENDEYKNRNYIFQTESYLDNSYILKSNMIEYMMIKELKTHI